MKIDHNILGYLAKEENFNDGEFIVREGSGGHWVYVIIEGKARVKKNTPKGSVTIDALKEGDIFGEMVLWQSGQGARTASVIADGPVRVGVLDSEQLLRDYETISPRLKSLLRSLIMRLNHTTKKAVVMAVQAKDK